MALFSSPWPLYYADMTRRCKGLVLPALLLGALSSCGTNESPPTGPTAAVVPPCHGAFVADVDTDAKGEATMKRAAEAWAKSAQAPSGAPTTGWAEVDVNTLQRGDWTMGLTPTRSGGWIVSGLGCGADED